MKPQKPKNTSNFKAHNTHGNKFVTFTWQHMRVEFSPYRLRRMAQWLNKAADWIERGK